MATTTTHTRTCTHTSVWAVCVLKNMLENGIVSFGRIPDPDASKPDDW